MKNPTTEVRKFLGDIRKKGKKEMKYLNLLMVAMLSALATGCGKTYCEDLDEDGWPVCDCEAAYADGTECENVLWFCSWEDEIEDCDDTDAAVFPGAPELCDGLDNDCDATTEADQIDEDGDGWNACDQDCDDTVPTINPNMPDWCEDGIDQDCDGQDDMCDELDGGIYHAEFYVTASEYWFYDQYFNHQDYLWEISSNYGEFWCVYGYDGDLQVWTDNENNVHLQEFIAGDGQDIGTCEDYGEWTKIVLVDGYFNL